MSMQVSPRGQRPATSVRASATALASQALPSETDDGYESAADWPAETDAYTWELPPQDWPTDFDAVPYRLATEAKGGGA